VTWKDGYRDILALHPETIQRLQGALDGYGDGYALEGFPRPTVRRSTNRYQGLLPCGLTIDCL